MLTAAVIALSPNLLKWSWREESNPRPADYKSAALPTELRQLSGQSHGRSSKHLRVKGRHHGVTAPHRQLLGQPQSQTLKNQIRPCLRRKPQSNECVRAPTCQQRAVIRKVCQYRLHRPQCAPPRANTDTMRRVVTRRQCGRVYQSRIDPSSRIGQCTTHQVSARQNITTKMCAISGEQVQGGGGTCVDHANGAFVQAVGGKHRQPSIHSHLFRHGITVAHPHRARFCDRYPSRALLAGNQASQPLPDVPAPQNARNAHG